MYGHSSRFFGRLRLRATQCQLGSQHQKAVYRCGNLDYHIRFAERGHRLCAIIPANAIGVETQYGQSSENPGIWHSCSWCLVSELIYDRFTNWSY